MELLIDFLLWWSDKLRHGIKADARGGRQQDIDDEIKQRTNPKMQGGNWTPRQIINRYRQIGFSLEEYNNWEIVMFHWGRERGIWKPRKTRGIYKAKNELDGFLRFAFGGKYKWRRYKDFREYLQDGRKHSKAEAEAIIDKYQQNGVELVYHTLLNELQVWQQLRRKIKGTNAANAKWAKYRAGKTKKSESAKPAS